MSLSNAVRRSSYFGFWLCCFAAVLTLAVPFKAANQTVGQTWVEQGPGPILNGGGENLGNALDPGLNPGAGAVNAIAIDPTSKGNVIYAGTVNGGVWKTTNGTAGCQLGRRSPAARCPHFPSIRWP